jgi:hypothetical protein
LGVLQRCFLVGILKPSSNLIVHTPSQSSCLVVLPFLGLQVHTVRV